MTKPDHEHYIELLENALNSETAVRVLRVKEELTRLYKARGFKVKQGTLVRMHGPIRQLVIVDRSRYAPIYKLEVGVLHPEIEADLRYYTTWHIWGSACRLIAGTGLREDPKCRALLDEDEPIPDEERQRGLEEMVQAVQELFFDQYSTVETIEERGRDLAVGATIVPISLYNHVVGKEAGDGAV